MDRASSPSESAGVTASGAGGEAPATSSSSSADQPQQPSLPPTTGTSSTAAAPQQQRPSSSRYESQKRRDWRTFQQFVSNRTPPVTLARCGGTDVVEFLRYLDQFGKTRVHIPSCPHYGRPDPPAPCACPLRQAWGSLDALIGRLRGAYDESGGRPEHNPFADRTVASYLKEVRAEQAKARGIPYEKRRRRRGAAAGAGPSTTPGASLSSIPEKAPSSAGGGKGGPATLGVSSSGAIATDTTDVDGDSAQVERPGSPAPPMGGSSHSAS